MRRRPYPNVYRLAGLLRAADGTSMTEVADGRWVPSRPLGFQAWHQRWRAAWLVFTGKADAVVWPENQDDVYLATSDLKKPDLRRVLGT